MAPSRSKPVSNGDLNDIGTKTTRGTASPLSLKFESCGTSHKARVAKKQPLSNKVKPEQKMMSKPKQEKKTKTNLTSATKSPIAGRAVDKPFRFLDLPGELRNKIYKLVTADPKQALLVHVPGRARLRPRSAANAPNYADQSDSEDMAKAPNKKASKNKKYERVDRECNRPFFGLTQVCRQIREEYRPIYMLAQEIGIDLIHVGAFVECYYPRSTGSAAVTMPSSSSLSALNISTVEKPADYPNTTFLGNLTIALSSTLKRIETGPIGTDILPLLNTWVNSERIEAGFGRYHDPNRPTGYYNPERDGEAKDLYRLFGRKVEAGRKCGRMNMKWRDILHGYCLAEVRVIRQPVVGLLEAAEPAPGGPRSPTTQIPPVMHRGVLVTPYVPNLPRPYFRILFKPECKEEWMTSEDAPIPQDWLKQRGFGGMEHFFIKVGVKT